MFCIILEVFGLFNILSAHACGMCVYPCFGIYRASAYNYVCMGLHYRVFVSRLFLSHHLSWTTSLLTDPTGCSPRSLV